MQLELKQLLEDEVDLSEAVEQLMSTYHQDKGTIIYNLIRGTHG